MTEYSPYRPDAAPQGVQQERLVFVDPADRHGREFHIDTQGTRPATGADSPEVNEAVADAYRAVEQERDQAAARTPEHIATDAELGASIGANAQTFAILRPMVEQYGFNFDGSSVAAQREQWELN